MKYSPVIYGKLDASVVAIGHVEVWRATQLDYVSEDDRVLHDIEMEEVFQPEVHDFHVVEIPIYF